MRRLDHPRPHTVAGHAGQNGIVAAAVTGGRDVKDLPPGTAAATTRHLLFGIAESVHCRPGLSSSSPQSLFLEHLDGVPIRGAALFRTRSPVRDTSSRE